MSESSAKFIGRNRPPRVQIEYEVDIGAGMQRINLPFVVGVMSDLSGDAENAKEFDERGFDEFDATNFDSRMKAIAPKATFTVPNKLTGDGQMAVDLTFESMEDFSPAAVARRVDATRRLLEAREQLSNLLAVTDGKRKAEDLLQAIADAGPDGWQKVLEFVDKPESDEDGSLGELLSGDDQSES